MLGEPVSTSGYLLRSNSRAAKKNLTKTLFEESLHTSAKKDAETSHTTKTYPNIIATQNNPFFSRIKILSVSMFNRLTFQLTYPLHGFRLGSSDLPMPRRWRSPCSRASFQPSHLATAEAPLVGWWSHDAVMEFLIDVGKIGIYYDNSWDSMGYT